MISDIISAWIQARVGDSLHSNVRGGCRNPPTLIESAVFRCLLLLCIVCRMNGVFTMYVPVCNTQLLSGLRSHGTRQCTGAVKSAV